MELEVIYEDNIKTNIDIKPMIIKPIDLVMKKHIWEEKYEEDKKDSIWNPRGR